MLSIACVAGVMSDAAVMERAAESGGTATSSSPSHRKRAVIPSPALKYLHGSTETSSNAWAALGAELALPAPLAPRARQMPACSSGGSELSSSAPSRSRAASSSPAPAASPPLPLHLLDLPDDLFFHIFDYLSTVCLLRLSGQPACRHLRRLVLRHADFDLDLDRLLVDQQPSRSLTQSKSSYAPLVSQALQFQQLSVLTLASFGPLLPDSALQPVLDRHAPSLLSLSLRSNDLVSPCIESPSLTSLDLSRNRRLQCPTLSCAGLTQLDLSRTFVNDLDLERSCEGCGQLRVLRLQGCKNVRLLPLSLPQLRIVDLSGTAVLDDAVQRLSAQSPGLRVLFLNECSLLRSPVIASSTLTALSLRSCEGLRSASLLCPMLRELDLSDTGVSDAALAAALSCLSQLRVLSLRQCDQLAAPALTADLPLLESLELSMSAVQSEGVRTFMLRAPQLQSLQAAQCAKLTDGLGRDTALLSSSLSSLCDLNLRFSAVSEQDVDALLTACPVLSRLSISCCMLVTRLSSSSSSLRHLDMAYCPVDNAAFASILSSSSASSCLFPHLVSACFDQCNGLLHASARHRQLQELRLAGCRLLESLSVDCPSLSVLDVSSCIALSSLSLSADAVASLRLVHARHLAGYALAAITAQLMGNGNVEIRTMSQSIADSAYQPMARRQRREAAVAGNPPAARRQTADRQSAGSSSSRSLLQSVSPSSAEAAVSPSATSTVSAVAFGSNPPSPSSSPSSLASSPSPLASQPNHSVRSSPRPIERRREQREEDERSGSGSPSRPFQPSPPVRSRYLDASPRQQRSRHRHAASTALAPPSALPSTHAPLTPPVSMRKMLARAALSASSTPSSPAGQAASPASGSQPLSPHVLTGGSFAMSGVVLPASAQDLTRAVSAACSSSMPTSASSSSICSSASQPLPSSPHRSLPFGQAFPPLALCTVAPSLPDTRSSLSVLLKPLPAPLPRSALVPPCFPPVSKRFDSRASSLSSVDSMPRFLLNSIDVCILNASIAAIEGKLAAHDRLQQQQQQTARAGKGKITASAVAASSSSSVPSSSSSGVQLSAAARYGLKRQLAMLRARLKREERLLLELAVHQADGGEDTAGVGAPRRKLSS